MHHTARESSDVDLLVSFSDPPGLLRFVELENLLSARLGVKVDLVMRDALKPRIGRRVLSCSGMTFEQFESDDRAPFAVVRALEIV